MTTPTPTPIEGAKVDGGGTFVIVTDGPAWLADLLYGPPWWLYMAFVGAFVAVAILTARGATNIDDTAEAALVAEEGARNLTLLVGIGFATLATDRVAGLGYVAEISLGVGVGWVLAVLLRDSVGNGANALTRWVIARG